MNSHSLCIYAGICPFQTYSYICRTYAELIGEGVGETTSDKRGKNEANVGKLVPITSTTYHGSSKSLEILKCIVYGGLIELITSLSIVSSAAASDATTRTSLTLNKKIPHILTKLVCQY